MDMVSDPMVRWACPTEQHNDDDGVLAVVDGENAILLSPPPEAAPREELGPPFSFEEEADNMSAAILVDDDIAGEEDANIALHTASMSELSDKLLFLLLLLLVDDEEDVDVDAAPVTILRNVPLVGDKTELVESILGRDESWNAISRVKRLVHSDLRNTAHSTMISALSFHAE